MKTDFKYFIESELIPAAFERIPEVLPGLDFTKRGSNWISPNRLDGQPSGKKKADKLVVRQKYLGKIWTNYGDGGGVSLIDAIKQRKGCGYWDVIRHLEEVTGCKLPTDKKTRKKWEEQAETRDSLDKLQAYFVDQLQNNPEAERVRAYLQKERGYTIEQAKAMGLGYYPGEQKMAADLKKQGIKGEAIKGAIPTNPDPLTIPFKAMGEITGFKTRIIAADPKAPKYQNPKGLDKSTYFYNIKYPSDPGQQRLIIVEGEIDALHAESKGIEGVVAMAGGNVTAAQVRNALKIGYNRFILCFDHGMEPDRAIAVILEAAAEEFNREAAGLFVADLPEVVAKEIPGMEPDSIDPDSVLSKPEGEKLFKKAIDQASIYHKYQYKKLIKKHEGKDSTDALIYELKQEGARITHSIPTKQGRKGFIDYLQSEPTVQAAMIPDPDSLEEVAQEKRQKEQKKRQNLVIDELAHSLTAPDPRGSKRRIIERASKDLEELDHAGELDNFAQTTDYETFKAEEANKPAGLDAGLFIGSQDIHLPSGGITVIAAPTGHGKTVITINAALQAAKNNPDKRFLFITYEEQKNSILQYFFNAHHNDNIGEVTNRIAIRNHFTGKYPLSPDEGKHLEDAAKGFFKEFIETGRITVVQTDFTSDKLKTAIEREAERGDIGGVFVDYFQLLDLPEGSKYTSRQDEVKTICLQLNNMAKQTGLPVILAAQFNREVKNPERMHANHIREAADIEHIANTIIGAWSMRAQVPPTPGFSTNDEVSSFQAKVIDNLGFNEYDFTDLGTNPNNDHRKGYLYINLLKSRQIQPGIYDFWKINGKTDKITTGKGSPGGSGPKAGPTDKDLQKAMSGKPGQPQPLNPDKPKKTDPDF